MFPDRAAVRVCRRQHETTKGLVARTVENILQRLFVHVAQHEVAAAIDDATHDVPVGMDADGFERMSTPHVMPPRHILPATPAGQLATGSRQARTGPGGAVEPPAGR